MSAQVGWRVFGHEPQKKKKRAPYDKEERPKALTPPFSSQSAADEFAEILRRKGYTVTGVRWHGPSQK